MSTEITARFLVEQIQQLGIGQEYEYVGGKKKWKKPRLVVLDIQEPEGPILFETIKPDGTRTQPRRITRPQLATMAYICSTRPNFPLHIDRIFSAGGNSRSALETLLA